MKDTILLIIAACLTVATLIGAFRAASAADDAEAAEKRIKEMLAAFNEQLVQQREAREREAAEAERRGRAA